MVDIQSPKAEIRRGIKKRKIKDRKKPQGKNIMSASATQGGHNYIQNVNGKTSALVSKGTLQQVMFK